MKIFRYCMMVWFSFFYINVVAANFVLGLSSIDQIFFGTVLGLWLGYLCNSFLRKPLDQHITKLLNGEYHVIGYNSLLKSLLVIVVVDFIIVSGLYALNTYKDNFDIDKESWFIQIKKICPKDMIVNRIMFNDAEFATACI